MELFFYSCSKLYRFIFHNNHINSHAHSTQKKYIDRFIFKFRNNRYSLLYNILNHFVFPGQCRNWSKRLRVLLQECTPNSPNTNHQRELRNQKRFNQRKQSAMLMKLLPASKLRQQKEKCKLLLSFLMPNFFL